MRIKVHRLFKFIVLISSALFLSIQAKVAGVDNPPATILESNDRHIIFELNPFEVDFEELSWEGEKFDLPVIDGYDRIIEPGKPWLPIKAVLIAIPEAVSPTIQILESQLSDLGPKNICPAPTYAFSQENNEPGLIERHWRDETCYSQNCFYPKNLVEISSLCRLRHHHVARVEFHPLQYNPVTQELKKVKRLKVAILFNRNQSTQSTMHKFSPPIETGSYELLLNKTLQNYPIARQWQRHESAANISFLLEHQKPEWYNPNATFYKLVVKEEGIYRLDFSYLDSIGVDLSAIDPRTIKIYNKGVEQHLFVLGEDDGQFNQTDFLAFYGQPNVGDTSYFDPYTDDNIYWLTWGGNSGLRMHKKSNILGNSSRVDHYLKTHHLEEEKVYHHGVNDFEIHNTEPIRGEGWVWRFFFPGESEIINFYITNLAKYNAPCSLKIKLKGTTIDPVWPNHHVRFTLNDTMVGDLYFTNVEEYLFETAVTALKEGQNKLVIQSVGDTGAKIDQFLLDWIEVTYPRQLVAEHDYLRFDLLNTKPDVHQVSIWGFSDSQIEVFDLTNNLVIENLTIAAGRRMIVEVFSAGFNDGNFARVSVNGQAIVQEGYRGHNLAVLNEISGQVMDIRHFDTYSSSSEADNMAHYIQNLPTGRIVLAAIRDEGSAKMTENAYLALESLGSQLARSVQNRDSWAMIGKKGAAPGSAIEKISPAGSGVAIVQDTLIVPGEGHDFYVSFNDSLASNRIFAIVSKAGLKTPAYAVVDTFINLKSSARGADLIIITHPNFKNAAQRLAEFHRYHHGLRVEVVDVYEIYDEFNFGLLNPLAIKDFLQYAFYHWEAPAPCYVIFFGDASWDIKRNLGEAAKINYVPSYGNPVSDNRLVCFDGESDVLPEMLVGRIPVETEEQAEIVVDKIIAYENTATGSWKKNILFITGGFNKSEQRTFMNQSNAIINNLVAPPPASCQVFQINKTTEGYFEGEKKQEVLDAINRGMMWVNFLGHAGSRTWDLMFNHPDIEELTNKDKYPFITSMTCHTGRFAEPDANSFGEHFLVVKDKGAIGFWGTTGWGYVFQDNVLLKNLFRGALVDTIHLLGEATTFAKIKLWESYGSSFYNVNVINQYSLLGDPISNLTLPEKPDLTLGPNDVNVVPRNPSEADSFATLNLKIQNWGLATKDSFKIDLYDLKDNQSRLIAGKLPVPQIGLIDSVGFQWNLKDQAGQHIIRVVLDADNEIDEVAEDNNVHEFPIFVYSSKITISRPFEFQVIPPKNVILQVNNPAGPTDNPARYYQFELDTAAFFNSPALITSPAIREGTIVTQWAITELSDGQTYFWRSRVNEDTEVGNWVSSSFMTRSGNVENTWRQSHLDQFIQNHFDHIQLSRQGLQLEARSFILQVESAGYADGDYARITVNNVPVAEQHRGHNLVVMKPNTGQIVTYRSFDTWASQQEANALAYFINGLENGIYVLIAIKDDGSLNMTEKAYQALESIGSKLCRQVRFRDSWATIGIKGAPIGTVEEQHVPATQGIATVRDTLICFHQQGTVTSTPIGPANRWHRATWNQVIQSPSSHISLDVFGFDKKLSQWDTLLTGLTNFNQEDLSGIDAQKYPLLKLRANLADHSGLQTPMLQDWAVSYEPVSDPAINYQVVSFSADTVLEGEPLKMRLSVYNVGMKIVDSVRIRFSLHTVESGPVRLGEEPILTQIPIDSFRVIEQNWETSGWMGNAQIIIEVDPDNELNELSETNNYYAKPIYVVPDSAKPEIVVTYDGKRLVSGDYVAGQPIILINIYDNARLLVDGDTSRITILLDSRRISFAGNEHILTVIPVHQSSEPRLRAQIRFTPSLSDGEHRLEVFVKDARNNLSYHRDDFLVTSEFRLLHVFNYPNPFRDATEFTFRLTQPADKVTIKIFTVAGRLIRTLEYHFLEAGFHHLYWDGRDQDQDHLANGVYLYKVIARSGEQQIEQIEKLVIMR